MTQSPAVESTDWRQALNDALRYWEPRRIGYNLILTGVVAGWLVITWPHFRESMTLQSVLFVFVLAVLANVCYCAAYVVDIPLQLSAYVTVWRRSRAALWWLGVLFAAAITWFWIADEIYPVVIGP